GRLSIHQFLSNLKRRLERNPPTIYEVAHDLYADYVILQHQLIASGKLPENTFRFRREGDRIRFYSLQNSLAFAASRFDALSTTVYELGLCGDMRLPVHSLTNDGQRLLDEGDVL
ncbi:MAG TPA: hypothetical protein PLB78_14110, partial [Anaerolineae bacterium]|nr:hypothetical protein [Anaerolineae bacterium]